MEFVGLPEEARNQIRQWTPLTLHPSGSAEDKPLVEQMEPAKDVLPTYEPKRIIVVPESETKRRVDEHQGPHSIAEDPPGVLPSTAETQDTETVSPHIGHKSAKPAVTENARHKTNPPLCLSYQETTSLEIGGRGPTIGSRKSRKRTGLVLTTVLLLSGFFFLGSRFQRTANGSQGTEVIAAAKVAELSPVSAANPKTLSVDPNLPLDHPGFVLQVGAMTHEENADALAESLRQRNFPVIVSRSATGRLYRVVVGPYGDVDLTLRAKEQLKKQGFDAFRVPWNPSAQQVSPS